MRDEKTRSDAGFFLCGGAQFIAQALAVQAGQGTENHPDRTRRVGKITRGCSSIPNRLFRVAHAAFKSLNFGQTPGFLAWEKTVDKERTQRVSHYGLCFFITRFNVMPHDQLALKSLCLLEAKQAAPQVRQRLLELYDKMLARDLPCLMTVAISKPLRRQQADTQRLENL